MSKERSIERRKAPIQCFISGNLDDVRQLIEGRPKLINKRDATLGEPLFYYAVTAGRVDLVRWLLTCSTLDYRALSKNNETVFHALLGMFIVKRSPAELEQLIGVLELLLEFDLSQTQNRGYAHLLFHQKDSCGALPEDNLSLCDPRLRSRLNASIKFYVNAYNERTGQHRDGSENNIGSMVNVSKLGLARTYSSLKQSAVKWSRAKCYSYFFNNARSSSLAKDDTHPLIDTNTTHLKQD